MNAFRQLFSVTKSALPKGDHVIERARRKTGTNRAKSGNDAGIASSLPPELIWHILSYIPQFPLETSLVSVCLICRSWSRIAIQKLYSYIEPTSYHSLRLLLRTFDTRPELADLVRHLILPILRASPWYRRYQFQTNRITGNIIIWAVDWLRYDVARGPSNYAEVLLNSKAEERLSNAFKSMVASCRGVEELHLSFLSKSQVDTPLYSSRSLRTIALDGFTSATWFFRTLQVSRYPLLETLILCDFSINEVNELSDLSVTSGIQHLPVLRLLVVNVVSITAHHAQQIFSIFKFTNLQLLVNSTSDRAATGNWPQLFDNPDTHMQFCERLMLEHRLVYNMDYSHLKSVKDLTLVHPTKSIPRVASWLFRLPSELVHLTLICSFSAEDLEGEKLPLPKRHLREMVSFLTNYLSRLSTLRWRSHNSPSTDESSITRIAYEMFGIEVIFELVIPSNPIVIRQDAWIKREPGLTFERTEIRYM